MLLRSEKQDFLTILTRIILLCDRFVEKKMALLKVKGEIQELLSLSHTCMAKKNRLEIVVSNSFVINLYACFFKV